MNILDPIRSDRRSFLFLQGMASRFFGSLGKELAARGHAVHRVNFNGGDMLFWPLPGAINFRGSVDQWQDAFAEIVVSRRVTDVILFGDCRPLHQAAIAIARQMQVPVHVCEEGYIRPHWVTFERDGVNGYSSMPRHAGYYLEAARTAPPLATIPQMTPEFGRRAFEDVLYNVASMALRPLYPRFRTHRPRHPLVEYAGWLAKFAQGRRRRRRSALAEARLDGAAFTLFPLQLNCDMQIRQHSTFGSMSPVIETVLRSFAEHAPADSLLVIKEHPLDEGLINWRRMVLALAAQIGVAERVIYLEFGNLDLLIARSSGVVTVNSTTGTLALALGAPVIVLGTAIYDMAGLTHQTGLERFWTEATPPEAAVFDAFRQVIAARCLLAGSFFSEQGIRTLVGNAVARLEGQPGAHPVQVPFGRHVPEASAVQALPG